LRWTKAMRVVKRTQEITVACVIVNGLRRAPNSPGPSIDNIITALRILRPQNAHVALRTFGYY
jgi:hypothetical protein